MTKAPPISLRVPADTRTLVEQWATKQGVPRNAAYVTLIQRGLRASAPLNIPARQPKGTLPAPPRKHVNRLKGEWKAP